MDDIWSFGVVGSLAALNPGYQKNPRAFLQAPNTPSSSPGGLVSCALVNFCCRAVFLRHRMFVPLSPGLFFFWLSLFLFFFEMKYIWHSRRSGMLEACFFCKGSKFYTVGLRLQSAVFVFFFKNRPRLVDFLKWKYERVLVGT